MKTLRTTITSGWNELWTVSYRQRDGETTIRSGTYFWELGRWPSYRDAVAVALSVVAANPRWSAARKAEAERGAELRRRVAGWAWRGR